MRSLERHRDAGAYALGVLDAADTFRFDDHLMDCPACRALVEELGPAAQQLAAYDRVTPPHVEPLAVPGPGLVDRLLAESGRLRRAGRRRWLCAVAASVVLALAAPATAVLRSGGPGPEQITARDGRTGVSATLTARGRDWGTDIGLRIRDVHGGARVCELVAVGTDGSEQTVTTWKVPAAEHADGPAAEPPAALSTRGGAAMAREDIARYEVRTTDGQRLLTLRRP
ncbi:zf-HC2 domain-containing protein [Streptomyces durmitorensis]|uniref:Zf-HC2 domain-containing protein n=1 Tax=Streptomyces durmitorensis TaxID=319947 RepID=A0ABY4PNC1_9ACTN|nr:zf-HC2 domain-containing protein [Streptomyces durmitorensis]UQT54625.1 zf-HC2 domain-containing protein [Streptomyces durmitorensis]